MTGRIRRADALVGLVEAAVRRAVRRFVVLVLVVVVVRALVGVWPAAVLGAVVFTAEVIAVLAAIDTRTTRPQRSALPVPARPPADCGPRAGGELPGLDGRHVEFARGLAGMAAWYLDECEREAQR